MDKLTKFKSLHHQDKLLFLPNAWDVLSAMVLEQSGFEAVGTTVCSGQLIPDTE